MWLRVSAKAGTASGAAEEVEHVEDELRTVLDLYKKSIGLSKTKRAPLLAEIRRTLMHVQLMLS